MNSAGTEENVDGSVGGFCYKLQLGYPSDQDLLSTASVISSATHHLLKEPFVENTSCLFHYGANSGDKFYREEVAKLINTYSGPRVTRCRADNIVLTCGATHGLHLIATLLFGRGDTVFIENPSFFIAIGILRDDLKMNIVPAPVEEEGIDVDTLDNLLKQHLSGSGKTNKECNALYSSLVYIIPTFSNPQGYCLTDERCRKLVKVARRHNALIVCDDVYGLLHYHEEEGVTPPRLLIDYDDPRDPDYAGGNVVSNGSFSKILGPGIRLGWIEAGEKLVKFLDSSNTLFSGGGVNHYMSMVAAKALKMGLCQEHIEKLKKKYGQNLKKVLHTLRVNLPSSVKYTEPNGGYFIWVTLPEGTSADKLRDFSRNKYNVTFLPGKLSSVDGSFSNCLRICFTHYEEDDLLKAVQALCSAIREYLEKC